MVFKSCIHLPAVHSRFRFSPVEWTRPSTSRVACSSHPYRIVPPARVPSVIHQSVILDAIDNLNLLNYVFLDLDLRYSNFSSSWVRASRPGSVQCSVTCSARVCLGGRREEIIESFVRESFVVRGWRLFPTTVHATLLFQQMFSNKCSCNIVLSANVFQQVFTQHCCFNKCFPTSVHATLFFRQMFSNKCSRNIVVSTNVFQQVFMQHCSFGKCFPTSVHATLLFQQMFSNKCSCNIVLSANVFQQMFLQQCTWNNVLSTMFQIVKLDMSSNDFKKCCAAKRWISQFFMTVHTRVVRNKFGEYR